MHTTPSTKPVITGMRYFTIPMLYIALASCSMSEIRMEKDHPGSVMLKEGDRSIIDPEVKMSRKDFENNLIPSPLALRGGKAPQAAPVIPESSPLLIAPGQPEGGSDKLVSLSVTEDIPLKDVLLELARLADIDVELDPNISGGVILRVKDKPFNEVVERIASLANLRYSFDNGTMKVERDLPYIENYKVDFLNIARSNESNSSINTKVISQVNAGGVSTSSSTTEGAIKTGTTSNLSSSYDGDLWGSVKADIARMLGLDPKNPDKKDDKKKSSSSSSDTLDAFDTGARKGSTSNENPNFLAVNQQAGIITVRANSKQQKSISKYLDRIKKAVSAQVLIEAKVVEVNLSKKYRTGINWNLLDKNINLSAAGNFTQPIQGQSDIFTLGVLNKAGNDLEAAVNLTESFGTSRILSSPRLHAINNQQAVLSFAFNQVFFTLDAQEREDQLVAGGITKTLNISSQVNTIPIGVVLNLQPSIDPDTDEITMNIRPTLSRIRSEVDDPGVTILAARNNVQNVRSSIPIVEVRELDSVLKIKSGQIMVIGGLMEERSTNDETGIPVLGTLPVFGKLFKGVAKDSEVVETVIFIKATVVPGYGVSKEDQRLYRNFVRDPRPLAF